VGLGAPAASLSRGAAAAAAAASATAVVGVPTSQPFPQPHFSGVVWARAGGGAFGFLHLFIFVPAGFAARRGAAAGDRPFSHRQKFSWSSICFVFLA